MGSVWQDLRYAARSLRQHPLFTVVAVVTIGLGIGANTAIFSIVNAVVLRPLPYQQPEQLIGIARTNTRTGEREDQSSFPNFRDIRAQATTLTTVAAFRYWLFNLSGTDHPQSLLGLFVSDSIFSTLRVHPTLGRTFTAGAEAKGYPREALLSYGVWQRRFGGDRSVIGTAAVVDGLPTTIVGVLPRDFRFPDLVPASAPLPSRVPDLYLPMGNLAVDDLLERGNTNYWILGRLKPGVTEAASAAELKGIGERLANEYPGHNRNSGIVPVLLQERITGDASRPLGILFGAVALVLLIACANVGGLLLARAVQRQREISIRMALGASAGRLARQLLTESLLLALLGGLLGIGLASWGVGLLGVIAPNSIPRIDEATVDLRVLCFALASALVTGILFGMAPVLQQRRGPVALALRESGRTSGSGAARRLRATLVVVEVALAVVLLTGAGLLLRSFAALASVPPGFDGTNVMTMFTLLPPSRYASDTSMALFEKRALDELSALPGVVSASATNTLPLSGLGNTTTVEVVGDTRGEPLGVDYRLLGGTYFKTMGISLMQGRDFAPSDTRDAPPVVILNESAARRFFPGADPVGRQLKVNNGDARPRTVVGVVADVRGDSLSGSANPEVSAPYAQAPDIMISLAIRTRSDPRPMLPQIRRALAGVDPDQGFYAERTMDDLLSASLAARRFNLQLLGGFALLALVLSSVGLYGVVAFSVSQRTREIGIRAALGAERGRIARLVLTEGARLGAIGLGLGLVASLALTRVLSGLLFHVSSTDPATFVGVLLFLGGVVLLASYVPARRAARIDPVDALRSE